MAISSLTKYFLLLLLPLLAASVPIDSNTMDLGNGIYFHNEAGEVTNFVALEDLQSRAADTTPRSVDVSPLEERALAYTAKCFSATFDTNDKSVGLGDLSDILGRYPTLASKSSISFTYVRISLCIGCLVVQHGKGMAKLLICLSYPLIVLRHCIRLQLFDCYNQRLGVDIKSSQPRS